MGQDPQLFLQPFTPPGIGLRATPKMGAQWELLTRADQRCWIYVRSLGYDTVRNAKTVATSDILT
jgi:hypothetical protein